MKKCLFFYLIICFTITTYYAQDITVLEPVNGSIVEWIDITKAWSETSVSVISGKIYTILVDGVASTQGGSYKQHRYYVGPEGMGAANSTFIVPEANAFSVVGKIGVNGNGFYVGKVFSFKANVSGKLYLGYNDNGYFDNKGFYVAYIFEKNYFPSTKIEQNDGDGFPSAYSISQNYPNPFNPTTTIQFELPESGNVELNIYDVNGEVVKTLINRLSLGGAKSVIWDGKNNEGQSVASGTYFYQIKFNNSVQTKKMLLLK